MERLAGIPVSQGVVVGEAFVLGAEGPRVSQRFLKPRTDEAALREHEKFVQALASSKAEARLQAERLTADVGAKVGAIGEIQVALHDELDLLQFVESQVKGQYWASAYAVERFVGKQRRLLERTTHGQRGIPDLDEFEKRLLRHLLGEERQDLSKIETKVIVVAADLTPGQTAEFPLDKVIGIATDHGGKTSHTAIIAQSRGIPAVVGLGKVTKRVKSGETLILEAGPTDGRVTIAPDEATLAKAQEREQRFAQFDRSLVEILELPAETLDGHVVRLTANVEFPSEISDALRYGAEGIGLYRTEFLYTDENPDPSEDLHYQAYREAVERVGARPLVIRTLDLGADKFSPAGIDAEKNPFLGCRSIRWCLLERTDVFRRQLRAILRASAAPDSDVRIMLPMISSLKELEDSKHIIEDTMEELRAEGKKFDENVQVGIMIEVPSAAIIADVLAQHADFFSVGTNDLVQYALAVDRVNEKVAGLYQPAHPAIFRLLLRIIEAARRYRKHVSICGELAGDIGFTLPLIGIGLRDLSMAPASIPKIKKLIRSITAKEASAISDQVLTMGDASTARSYLEGRARDRLPELYL